MKYVKPSLLLFLSMFLFPVLYASAATPYPQMKHSTVRVLSRVGNEMGFGSGFVVGYGQHVVTCWHVVRQSGGNAQILVAGNKVIDAVTIWRDEVKDLAILKTSENLGRKPVRFVRGGVIGDGEKVFAVGFPGAADNEMVGSIESVLDAKVTSGIISAVSTSQYGVRYYQIDAPINPGNSGGPLFDEYGNVIGIAVAKPMFEAVVVQKGEEKTSIERLPSGEGIGWAVQADELFPAFDSLRIRYTAVGGAERFLQGKGVLIVVVILVFMAAVAGGYLFFSRTFQIKAKRQKQVASGQPVLYGIGGYYHGTKIEMDENPIIIGRDPHLSNLVYPAEATEVSRHHCMVRYQRQNGEFIIEDIGSTNGTFIVPLQGGNPKRLSLNKKYSLGARGRFIVGDKKNVFEVMVG